MKLEQFKNQVIILNSKQLLHIKGGNDTSNSTNIFGVEDIDVI